MISLALARLKIKTSLFFVWMLCEPDGERKMKHDREEHSKEN
jgi:hypothetical protein